MENNYDNRTAPQAPRRRTAAASSRQRVHSASATSRQQPRTRTHTPTRTRTSRQQPRTRTSTHTSRPSSRSSVTTLFGIPLRLLVLGVVLIVLLALAGVGIHSCVNALAQTPAEQPAEQTEEPSETPSDEVNNELPPDELAADWLYYFMDREYVDMLLEAAEIDIDARWIATYPQKLDEDGMSVQYKLLKLAAMEPAARSFVREWPEAYPSTTPEACDPVQQGTVPLLLQWDKRWGYTVYSGTTFALTGCCPTSFAMVYQGLTGDSSYSPYDMGVYAKESGHMSEFNGTDTGFFYDAARRFGLQVEQISSSVSSAKSALQSGKVLICNVGPGDFTTGGHYIVITGVDSDGLLIINDPYSVVRSNKHWDADTVMSQTLALFAFWR